MLRLRNDGYRILREDVEQAYPEEGCGILLGHKWGEGEREVMQVVSCVNADAEARRRYSIAPEELIAVQRRAREAGLEILGFYHSHPDGSTEASGADLREAHWTGCVYVICRVDEGKLVEIAAMHLEKPGEWATEPVRVGLPEEET